VKKRWFYAVQLVISLAIITGLATGCNGSPSASTPRSVTTPESKSTSTPLASEYPADISGRITIAETVNAKYQSGSNAGETMEMTPLKGQIYWIVEISVKNKSYQGAVTASGWKILVDDKKYDTQPILPGGIQPAYPLTIPVGGTGKTIIRFPVPDTLNVSDAKLCYQGQEPYSYGKLTGGEKVAAYDWDLKTPIEQSKEKEVKIEVTRIQVSNMEPGRIVGSMLLWTTFKPTGEIKANTPYTIRLYENSKFREECETKVIWNQPELNVNSEMQAYFQLTKEETQAYKFQDLSNIFSIKAFEAK